MIELNAETRWILGRPCFALHGIAEKLRRAGRTIERKAEDEQAVVLHWMLKVYEETKGVNWRDEAQRRLDAMQPASTEGSGNE